MTTCLLTFAITFIVYLANLIHQPTQSEILQAMTGKDTNEIMQRFLDTEIYIKNCIITFIVSGAVLFISIMDHILKNYDVQNKLKGYCYQCNKEWIIKNKEEEGEAKRKEEEFNNNKTGLTQ